MSSRGRGPCRDVQAWKVMGPDCCFHTILRLRSDHRARMNLGSRIICPTKRSGRRGKRQARIIDDNKGRDAKDASEKASKRPRLTRQMHRYYPSGSTGSHTNLGRLAALASLRRCRVCLGLPAQLCLAPPPLPDWCMLLSPLVAILCPDSRPPVRVQPQLAAPRGVLVRSTRVYPLSLLSPSTWP